MKSSERSARPRARFEGLIVKELPDEVLVYDLERHKAHCLNRPAAKIWKLCDGETTLPEITRKSSDEIGFPVGEEVVLLALEQLSRARLLEEQIVRPGVSPAMSRREVIKRLGQAAAIAAPLVTSLIAPTAQAATSCACVVDGDCVALNCGTDCDANGICRP
jgi:hypothetical protein